MSTLSIRLLGGFQARIGPDVAVRVPPGKTQGLLAYLALRPGNAHPRDKLAALLWGEAPTARARHSLRQALVALRRALPRTAPACLVEEGDAVALNERAVEVDVAAFERLIATGTPDALARAVELYRGDLLEGLPVSEAPFEDWLVGQRERLRELVLEALARLVAHHAEAGPLESAVQFAVRLLALEPTQEAVHRTLMLVYERQGRRGAALRQYQVCVAALQRELGEEPEAETRRLYHHLLRHAAPASVARGPAESSPPDAGAAAAAVPLAGRDGERRALDRLLVEAAGGRGTTVALLGEAGVGKTRLAEELAARAAAEGFRVLLGRAYEMERGLPFGPWAELLRAGLAGVREDELHGFAAVWRAHLRRILPEMWTAEPDPPRSAQNSRGLFDAVAQLLGQLATRRPLLVILEDAHWADETTLRLLVFLGRRLAGARVLLAVTARDEDLSGAGDQALASLDREGYLVRLGLERLDEPTTRALVTALARPGVGAADAARLARRVWAISEGNPFMIVESVRAEPSAPERAGDDGPLPERVRDLVLVRIKRLGRRAQALLGVAAVLGRQFDFGLLRGAARLAGGDAAAGIEELVRRRILRAVGEQFEFTHDSIRRVAYERLLAPVREQLHLVVARALERRHAQDIAPVQDVVAHHYARTGAASKAIHHLVACAETASRRYAVEDSIRLLEDALARVDRMPVRGRERVRVDLALRLAVALAQVGRFGEILDRLSPLVRRVEGLGDARLAGAYHARVALAACILGRDDIAGPGAERALGCALSSGDDTALGQAHYVLAVGDFVRGHPHRGIGHAREAIGRFDRTGDRLWVTHSEWIHGLNLWLAGDLDAALDAEERVERIGEALEDPGLVALGAWTGGLVLVMRGDGRRALEAGRRSLRHAPDPPNQAAAQAVIACAGLLMGETPEAADQLAGAIEQLRPFQIRCAVLYPLLSDARRVLGDVTAAVAAAEQGVAVSREAGFAWGVAAARRTLGQALRAAGSATEADSHLEEALAAFEAIPSPADAARTRLALAEGDGRAPAPRGGGR